MATKKSSTSTKTGAGKNAKPTGSKAPAGTLYQFKITLKDTEPPIWRRIQVMDCTLDQLHEHIQGAMGWSGGHLHQFEIGGQRYSNPEMMEGEFDDDDTTDSTATKLSKVIPPGGKRFRFRYEYDFGDGWMHDILLESTPAPDPKVKYPVCVDGARACPPEDVGGPGGYADFVEAIGNPKHQRHEELLEWNGPFDSEAFNANNATKAMRMGVM